MSFEKHITKRKKVPFLSFVLLGILIMGCVFAPFFCKDASYMDLINCSRAPGREFFFGTDTMGRDLFSCIWHGGRVSLTIGFLSTAISAVIAVLYGTASALSPAWLDRLLMRLVDVLLSVPSLLLVLFVQAVFGKNIIGMSAAIGLCGWFSMAKIAVLGYGVVGSGTVEVIEKNKEGLLKKAGQEIEIKYILDLRDFPDSPYKDKFVKDFNVILNDPEISVVVEVIGGIKPSYDFVKSSLLAGKSVVTSNKELVAKKGAELLKIAHEKGVNFFFEASVGGGIPIIRPLHQCLSANRIDEIAGILNGTTNFILTKMIRDNMAFDDALKTAQELGYAERNPSADVDGIDACRKICILASLSFGKHVYPDNIHTEGITKITPEDVAYCENFGGSIKLIGWASRQDDGKIAVMVCPAFIHEDSQLAGVNDVFNAILVRGDSTGDVVFYGKGAGKFPTASAVVADVVIAVKMNSSSKSLYWEDSDQDFIEDTDKIVLENYIRVNGVSKDEAEALFGKVSYLTRKDAPEGELAFITPAISEKDCNEAVAKLGDKLLGRIRVLDY